MRQIYFPLLDPPPPVEERLRSVKAVLSDGRLVLQPLFSSLVSVNKCCLKDAKGNFLNAQVWWKEMSSPKWQIYPEVR